MFSGSASATLFSFYDGAYKNSRFSTFLIVDVVSSSQDVVDRRKSETHQLNNNVGAAGAMLHNTRSTRPSIRVGKADDCM